MKVRFPSGLFSIAFFLSGCAPSSFFYYPNRVLYTDPHSQGIDYKMLEIESLNGKTLSAVLFETNGPAKGTVVHFHGNFANVSNHLTQSMYLMNHGFDVLVFDYQGYGGSKGKPSPKNTVEDGQAVVRYARDHLRDPHGGVFILGQSLGGAVGIVVMAKETYVRAGVFEAPFSSYRSIARHAIAKAWILWPLYPIYPFMVGTRYDPIKYVGKISPRPILFIHGDHDEIVPLTMSKRLFSLAGEPKHLWVVSGANHLGIRRQEGSEYENRISEFFSKIPIDRR
jgi:fermentation-respiration switch protein FrsA (DUF1100 family)